MTFKKSKFKARFPSGDKTFNGYVSEDGLFGIDERDGGWRVTHIPTGFAATRFNCAFDKLSQAKKYVDSISGLIDWSKVSGVSSLANIGDKILQLQKEAQSK